MPGPRSTEQAIEDSGSATRIGKGAVARQSAVLGHKLACGVLETPAAEDAGGELLHVQEREREPGKSVSLQVEIELPEIVRAPGGEDHLLQWWGPFQEQPQRFRKCGTGIDVFLRDSGEL